MMKGLVELSYNLYYMAQADACANKGVVTVTAKGSITYTYDAGGNKLKKTTIEGAKTTTTLYMGSIIYQNDTLQFISHEEGRVRWALHKYTNGTTGYKFEYDYFLKDHLGNTRMVLTQEKDTTQYIATMEAAYRNTENQLFYNIPASSYPRASVAGYPTDNTTIPNDSLARVNGSGQKTGPSLLLRVMSGDVVDVATKSFYKSGGTVNNPNSTLTDILNSLAGGIVTATSGSHGAVTDFTNSSGPLYAAVNSFLPTNDPNTTGKPKAYLNWILLDDQFKGVSTYPQSGAIVVGSADVLNTLAYSGIPITKNGYLYIWVSNETPGWDVFFDNLSVKTYSGPITEETHYYPFGLTMAGISSKSAGGKENKLKFLGKELQNNEFTDGSGLELYDFSARMYDQQTGHFPNPDALSEKFYQWSPYSYSFNNPVRFGDASGMAPDDWVGSKNGNTTTWKWDENIKSAEQAKAAGYDDYKAPGSIIDNSRIGSGELGSVYLGNNAKDVSYTYPNKTVTPFQVGTEWLSGKGPRNRSFTNGDYFTELLRQHDHVTATKAGITDEITNGAEVGKSGVAPYSLGGIQGVGKYVKDYSTLLTAGQTGNLAVTYLGSYDLNWKITGINDGAATVQFTVNNSSTMQSASRPPVLGYLPAWQNTIGKSINNYFSTGWGSKTTQTFNWTETITIK